MAAKAAIRDAARVLGFPYADADRIAKLIPRRRSGRGWTRRIRDVPGLRALHEGDGREKELLDIALGLEGLSRHASTHAAGVVIAPRPLVEFAPLSTQSNRDEITTQCAKDEIEEIGLLKMDFLGLKTLTLIADCRAADRAGRPDPARRGRPAAGRPPDLRPVPRRRTPRACSSSNRPACATSCAGCSPSASRT